MEIDRRCRRHGDREVDRHVAVAALRIHGPRIGRPDVHPARRVVGFDPHLIELITIAVRTLDGLDRHVLPRSARDDDVAGDVRDADAAVASEPIFRGKTIGLLRPAVAPLIRADPYDLFELRLRARRSCGEAKRGRETQNECQSTSHDRYPLPLRPDTILAAPASLPLRISLISATVSSSSASFALKLSSRLCCAGALAGCARTAARLSVIA